MRNVVNANCVTHFGNVGGMEAADRLKQARLDAGFRTAADAYRHFGWIQSTYLGHENGSRGQTNRSPSPLCPTSELTAWMRWTGQFTKCGWHGSSLIGHPRGTLTRRRPSVTTNRECVKFCVVPTHFALTRVTH